MRIPLAMASAFVLAACASDAPSISAATESTVGESPAVVRLIDGPAPGAAETLAAIDSGPPCSNSPEERAFDASRYAGIAQRTFNCQPVFPDLAMQARFAGACRVIFDVDDSGLPLLPLARCNVGNQHGSTSSEWRTAARLMYERAALRSVETSRFSAKTPSRPDEGRSNLGATYRFDLSTWPDSKLVELPPVFQRPPPAPALPVCPPASNGPSSPDALCQHKKG